MRGGAIARRKAKGAIRRRGIDSIGAPKTKAWKMFGAPEQASRPAATIVAYTCY